MNILDPRFLIPIITMIVFFVIIVVLMIMDNQNYQKYLRDMEKPKKKPNVKKVGTKVVREKVFEKENPLEVKSDADSIPQKG